MNQCLSVSFDDREHQAWACHICAFQAKNRMQLPDRTINDHDSKNAVSFYLLLVLIWVFIRQLHDALYHFTPITISSISEGLGDIMVSSRSRPLSVTCRPSPSARCINDVSVKTKEHGPTVLKFDTHYEKDSVSRRLNFQGHGSKARSERQNK